MLRIKYALPFCLIVIISVWSIWPILIDPVHNVSGVVDSGLVVWIINQTVDKIPSHISSIFNGNIFYPYKNTLAYSDTLITSAILSYIPLKIFGEPVIVNSISLLIGQILLISIIYIWWREITGNPWTSLVAALAFGLSQIRFVYSAHVQMWEMQWFLLSTYFFWKFNKTGKLRMFYLALAFAVIQAWESLFPLVFILIVDIAIVFPHLKDFLRSYWKYIVLSYIAFLILIFPVLSAYYHVSKQFNYVRSIREVAHFSMGPDELLGDFFSPALFGLFLFVIAAKRNILIKNRRNFYWIFGVLLTSFIFALGPVLKWDSETVKIFGKIFIPLPYGVFYYILPFLKAFRTPSRYMWLTGFAMSGIIALGLKDFNFKRNKVAIFAFLIIPILFSAKITQIYKLPSTNEYPAVYSWLKEQPGEVVMELPMYTWANGDITQEETNRMIYSLEHGKKLVNGYSGFFPPEWLEFVVKINKDFPNQETEKLINERNVNYIIVHKNYIDKLLLEKFRSAYQGNKVWENDTEVVYSI